MNLTYEEYMRLKSDMPLYLATAQATQDSFPQAENLDGAENITSYEKKSSAEEEKNGVGIFYFDKEKASRYSARSKITGAIPTGIVHTVAQAGIIVKPQTKTLQFKRWFKDSKVVDENGEPLERSGGTKKRENGGFFGAEDLHIAVWGLH